MTTDPNDPSDDIATENLMLRRIQVHDLNVQVRKQLADSAAQVYSKHNKREQNLFCNIAEPAMIECCDSWIRSKQPCLTQRQAMTDLDNKVEEICRRERDRGVNPEERTIIKQWCHEVVLEEMRRVTKPSLQQGRA